MITLFIFWIAINALWMFKVSKHGFGRSIGAGMLVAVALFAFVIVKAMI